MKEREEREDRIESLGKLKMRNSRIVILNEVKNPSSNNVEFWIMKCECEETKRNPLIRFEKWEIIKTRNTMQPRRG